MLFYVIWFLERCICRKNQPIGGCLRRGLVFVAYPHPRWGYPRAPVRPRIAGGAVYYTHKYKPKRGREDGPNKATRVNIPHSATLKALIALRFLYVVVNFAAKLHVYDTFTTANRRKCRSPHRRHAPRPHERTGVYATRPRGRHPSCIDCQITG